MAAQGDAYRFEATDIVAVSCLGVTVPAELAGWLLIGEGAEEAGLLLEGIPADAALQDHDLDGNPSAQALWCLLEGWTGMGPTKVSTLMAAKRPALVPIYDDFLGAALVPQAGHGGWRWWRPWQDLLQGPSAPELVAATEFVRAQASRKVDVSRLSTLRILDIVIWKSDEEERRSERGTR